MNQSTTTPDAVLNAALDAQGSLEQRNDLAYFLLGYLANAAGAETVSEAAATFEAMTATRS
jgi:hypothetical protein